MKIGKNVFYRKFEKKVRLKIYELKKLGEKRVKDLRAIIRATEIEITVYHTFASIHLITDKIHIGLIDVNRPFMVIFEEV